MLSALLRCGRASSQQSAGCVLNPLAALIPSTASTYCLSRHAISSLIASTNTVASQAPIPAGLQEELSRLEAQLKQSSQVDGTKRLTLSSSQLPFPIPAHEVEQGLLTIDAHVRPLQGRNACKWLRRMQRVPARVQGLCGPMMLKLHLPRNKVESMVSLRGRNGCQAQVMALRVLHPDSPSRELALLRVKPQMVHVTANMNQIENVDFVYCPQHRVIKVNVPVRLVNDDIAPGLKRGAWLHILKRTVTYQALGNCIPPFITVDVKHLDVGQAVTVRQLPIPLGTRLVTQNWDASVVECTTNTGND
ncbi:ribosomal protein L25/Gln-tRNA synthetase [Haematococcus lacustris]